MGAEDLKILVHIHTLNDMDVIRMCIDAVQAQSRPVDKIIIVDNGSSDGTPDIEFPENTTVHLCTTCGR